MAANWNGDARAPFLEFFRSSFGGYLPAVVTNAMWNSARDGVWAGVRAGIESIDGGIWANVRDGVYGPHEAIWRGIMPISLRCAA